MESTEEDRGQQYSRIAYSVFRGHIKTQQMNINVVFVNAATENHPFVYDVKNVKNEFSTTTEPNLIALDLAVE